MTLYLFWGIPAKYNLPVENFHPYGVQSSKVKEGCTVFPMQQNLSTMTHLAFSIGKGWRSRAVSMSIYSQPASPKDDLVEDETEEFPVESPPNGIKLVKDRTFSRHLREPGSSNSEGQGYSPNKVHHLLLRYLYTSP